MGKLSLVALTGMLVLLFQNCSKTGFSIDDVTGAGGMSASAASTDNALGNDVVLRLEPALAIRGMGCVQCHANVDSSIVTDFGYKGDGKGRDYFFSLPTQTVGANTTTWNSGGIYGDHGNNFNTMTIPADKSVFVPKAVAPAAVTTATAAKTLAEYIRGQFAKSTDAGTKAANVYEKSSIYIGAPTEADLANAFGGFAANERQKYFRDPVGSPLAGLQDRGNFFQNNSVVTCDGDLLLRGPLLLQNLQLNTSTGCRIHVIGSVFIYGPISFTNANANRNIQITSTKAIAMGLGNVKPGATFCEPNSNWAVYPTDPSWAKASSMISRFTDIWTDPSFMLRQSGDPKAFGNSVLAEAAIIEAAVGTLYDAACRGEGRNVSFERIVLNAPVVHSRYQGNVSGTIIAEFAVMALGDFKFKFDPVFLHEPLFPRLSKKIYLDVVD